MTNEEREELEDTLNDLARELGDLDGERELLIAQREAIEVKLWGRTAAAEQRDLDTGSRGNVMATDIEGYRFESTHYKIRPNERRLEAFCFERRRFVKCLRIEFVTGEIYECSG